MVDSFMSIYSLGLNALNINADLLLQNPPICAFFFFIAQSNQIKVDLICLLVSVIDLLHYKHGGVHFFKRNYQTF